MAQTREGARKWLAKRLGISLEEVLDYQANGFKYCYACKGWRPVGDFGKDSTRGDGLDSLCLECRASRYVRKQPGPRKHERTRQREAGFAWCRLCEAWKPLQEIHNGLCRPHANETARKKYAEDPAHRHERRQHAHSRKRQIQAIPFEGAENLLDWTEGACIYCGAPATTWDHLVPISRGGKTTPGNVAPACVSCNSSKKAQDLETWLRRKGRVASPLLIDILSLEDCRMG
jgi:5-methylcytosine-specific restriction endonuclease McrA